MPGPMTPGPTPLKGQGQGYLPDYRGSLQPRAGDAHNPIDGAVPHSPAPPASPMERRLLPAPHLGTGWSPASAQHGSTAVFRSPRSLGNKATREVAPAQSSTKGRSMPCGTALLQPAPWQGPGSAGSCHLARGASPALLTGTWVGLLLGTKGTARSQHVPQVQGWPAGSLPPRPRPWLQAGHGAHAATKQLHAVLRKQGQGWRLSPPVHFGHPPVAAQNSFFSPGKSKLRCSISKVGS